MRLMDWLMEDALDPAEVPFRHSRVAVPRRMVWCLAGCLAVLTFILLVSGAILTAIVYTEVRPPTADENYQRYLGSDYRRHIGPLMMVMALITFIVGAICLCSRRVSHHEDKKQMAILHERIFSEEQQETSRSFDSKRKDNDFALPAE